MDVRSTQKPSDRFTHLSDRFRSLWTFYQFLGGVFKHLDEGILPINYDFQALYKRLQELAPRMELELSPEQQRELERVEREIGTIHGELAQIEQGFPPSLLRRFFDHLKRQDEKILFALVKFYLMSDQLEQDAFDKLDILLTRLAEAPLDDGRVLPRDPQDLKSTFDHLASFGNTPVVPRSEERPLIEAIREFRREIEEISGFKELLNSQVFDRYRKLKQRLGRAFLHPPILVEIVSCNIEAKSRFQNLYQDEEVRILEDTNRILEIERYLEKNPNLAHEELRNQIDIFRESRQRYDTGRREGNLKREDILQMRQTMHRILEEYDGGPKAQFAEPHQLISSTPPVLPNEAPAADSDLAPPPLNPPSTPPPVPAPEDSSDEESSRQEPDPDAGDSTAISDSAVDWMAANRRLHDAAHDRDVSRHFPPDPILEPALHKIIYALDLVGWDHEPEQLPHTREIHHLGLEPWEIRAYQTLAQLENFDGSLSSERLCFYLTAAALRVKMQEEIDEIARLKAANREDRLREAFTNSSQSLERGRQIEERFKWFVSDMLYRGDTAELESLNRSRFRFLKVYSQLWLDHQAAGGMTPL